MSAIRATLAIAGLIILSGCSSPGLNIVPEARNEKPVSAILLTCGGKFKLDRDCSNLFGATREIVLASKRCRVASSNDGLTILIQSQLSDLPIYPNSRTKKTNDCFLAVKNEIEQSGVSLNRVIPVGNSGQVAGYILRFSKGAYHVLLPLTKGDET